MCYEAGASRIFEMLREALLKDSVPLSEPEPPARRKQKRRTQVGKPMPTVTAAGNISVNGNIFVVVGSDFKLGG